MFLLTPGKARIRKTGEIVYVVANNGESDKRRKTDWVSYIDANFGEHERVAGLNLAWDFEDIKDYEEREEIRAYQSHLCMFSGMVMQSLIREDEKLYSKVTIDGIAKLSVEYGKALCAELDNVDLEELMNSNR